MATTAATLLVKVKADLDQFNRGMQSAERRMDVAGKKATTTGERFKKGLGRAAPFAAAGLAAFAIGAAKGVKGASDLEEAQNKANNVFGRSAKLIPGASKSVAASLGISRAAALDNAASFGSMLQNMGKTQPEAAAMSKRILQLSSDMGSFHNADPTEMLERVRAGLSGEAEPLKRFGVLINEAAVKTEAYRSGLAESGSELTEQQKVQARYQLILKQTKDAHGDFAETSGGMANQTRIAKAAFTDMSAQLAAQLLPVVTRVLAVGLQVVNWMRNNETAAKVLIGAIVGLAGAIVVANTAVKAATTVTKIWAAAQAVLNFVLSANPIGIVITALAALVAGFVLAYKNSETFRNIVNGVARTLMDVWSGIKRFFGTTLPGTFQRVKDWVRGNWPEIVTLLAGPLAPIVAVGTDAFGIRTKMVATFNRVKDWVRNNWAEIVTLLSGPLAPIIAVATDAFGIRTKMVDTFNAVIDWVKDKWDVGVHLAKGIKEPLEDVNTWIGQKMAQIANVFIGGLNKIIGLVNKLPGVDIDKVPNIAFQKGKGFVQAARGMIATGPVAGVFGEDGTEALIPMTRKHRGTAIPLLRQAAAAHDMALYSFGAGGWVTGKASAYSPNDAGGTMASGDPFGWNTNAVAWPLRHGQHPGIIGTPISVRYGGKTVASKILDLGGIPHADIDLAPGVWRQFIGGRDPFQWGIRPVEYNLGSKQGSIGGALSSVFGGALPDLPKITASLDFMGQNILAGIAKHVRDALLSHVRSAFSSAFGQGSGGPGGLVTAAGGGGSGWVYPVGVKRIGGSPAAHHARALGNWQSDDAWDLMGNEGTPVFAATSGTIGSVDSHIDPRAGFWGGSFYQNVAGGQLWYKHLRNIFVRQGQGVSAGQLLGLLGGTGVLNGGPHLHLAGNPVGLLGNIPGLDTGGHVRVPGIAQVDRGDVYNPRPIENHFHYHDQAMTGPDRGRLAAFARELAPALERQTRAVV